MIDKLSAAEAKQKGGFTTPSKAPTSSSNSSSKKYAPVVDGETNLNKLSQVELDKIKSQMNTSFEENRKKATDRDFEYDKRVDFSNIPKSQSEWDDSQTEDEIEEDFDDFDI